MQLIADFGGTITVADDRANQRIARGSTVMIYLQRKNADAQEVSNTSCILLPWRYQARYVRRQPQIPLPVHLRHDQARPSRRLSAWLLPAANAIGVGGILAFCHQPAYMLSFALCGRYHRCPLYDNQWQKKGIA